MRNRSAHPMRVLGGLVAAAVITQHEQASPSQGAGAEAQTDRGASRPALLRVLSALSAPASGLMRVATPRAGDATMQALTKDVRRTGGSPQLVLDPFAISWGATDVAASLGFTPEKATEIVRWVDQNSDGRVDPKELRVAMKKVQAQPGFVDPFPAGPEGPEKDLILVFASEQLKKLAPEPAEEDLQAAAALQDALSEKYKLVQGLKERQEKAEAVLNEVGSPESKGPVQAATDFFLPQAEREKRARIRSAEETQKIVASVEEVIEYMDKIKGDNTQSSKKSDTFPDKAKEAAKEAVDFAADEAQAVVGAAAAEGGAVDLGEDNWALKPR